jgi:uncharacterized damage-inducible protein DinB
MERLAIVEELKHMPDAVAAETAGLDAGVLRHRPAAGEWSIMEIVGHLRNAAEVWHRRLHMVCTLTDPVVASWDSVVGAGEADFLEADLEGLIAEMRDWRLQTVDELSHTVDWTRIGTQPGVGRRSLKQFAVFMIEHETEHLLSIRALKTAQAARQPG